MSEPDAVGDALERLEWSDNRLGRGTGAARLTRRGALTGSAAGLVAVMLTACGSAAGTRAATGTTQTVTAAGPVAPLFGVKGGYRFTFVSHAKTNAYFTPTINGIQDACGLLGCAYEWTGSDASDVGQMASAITTAVSAGVDGIATTLVAPALATPVAAAISAGIPVVAYNADEPGSGRLAYVGQDLLRSGQEMGREILRLIPGGGEIVVFISTPGLANVAPRLEGIREVLRGRGITVRSQASGATISQEVAAVGAFIGAHQASYRGYFGVDAGSTVALAQAISRYNLKGKVLGGGFDLLPATQQLLLDGTIQFSIDQQPYLQGFLPTLELFLYRASERLTGAADVDTGVKFLHPRTIRPYANTTSRYEGTGTNTGVARA